MDTLQFIDSHTAGEPTRVIVAGGPDLGDGPLPTRLGTLRGQFDHIRRWTILEPRGSDALVGALLLAPTAPSCAAGVIFFNNAGYLGMCGHGAMGVAATLARLGRVEVGSFGLETPVGVVQIELLSPNRAAIENVPAYRLRQQVSVDVPGVGQLVGDIAWGGNWFFLVQSSPLPLQAARIPDLSDAAWRVRLALREQGINGAEGAEIDHIEFFGPPQTAGADSRNFVMCPGGAYDRSPCGTGTSAKLACLAADGKLAPGETWRQEGILGTQFEASYRYGDDGRIVPTISGDAYVTAEGRLLGDPADPFRHGIFLRGAT